MSRRRTWAFSALLTTFAATLALLVVGCDSAPGSPEKAGRKNPTDSGITTDAATGGSGGSSADARSATAGGGGAAGAGTVIDGGGAAVDAGNGGSSAADAGSTGGGSTGGNAGDASAAADGSVAPITLVDPVQGSEGDTTLDGTDADGNGLRDDVDAYIATLETDPRRVTALVSFARESTKMMLLGGAPSATKRAAVTQAQRVGRTIDCLHDLYASDLTTKQAILRNVRNALYDNAMRLTAYNHASTLVSGTLFRTGHGCDFAITGVSP